MIDAAPPGMDLNPIVADREHQRATAAIQAGALAAADEVATSAGDELLRDVAANAGLQAERLLSESLAKALGAGREFIVAPPGAGYSSRRLYGESELPLAQARFRDLLGAVQKLAIEQPSIADSYGRGGSTVGTLN